jgi:hypothetical protein
LKLCAVDVVYAACGFCKTFKKRPRFRCLQITLDELGISEITILSQTDEIAGLQHADCCLIDHGGLTNEIQASI